MTKNDKIFLGDFTADSRADYMIVGEHEKVNGLVNRLKEGLDEESPLVSIKKGIFSNATSPCFLSNIALAVVDLPVIHLTVVTSASKGIHIRLPILDEFTDRKEA